MFIHKPLKLSFGLTLSLLALSACEMKDPVKRTQPSPNPDYPAGATQPEGGSGTVRDQLPAGGAAATGGGVTSSNTSAASGAVSSPDHSPGSTPGPDVPTTAQPQVPDTNGGNGPGTSSERPK
ncbi:MAG: hypothetical protein EOP07_00520 [Proteobacteria bacterium]|nr:MAG: hypothetical protein EOP07_00520 [Pseudomonadota bacterium]